MNNQVTISCFSPVNVYLGYYEQYKSSYVYFLKISKDFTENKLYHDLNISIMLLKGLLLAKNV